MLEVIQPDKFARLPERYQRRAREIAVRVEDIDALFVPAKPEAILAAIVRMAKQFREQPETDHVEMATEYRAACGDLPAWAIAEAASDFLAGRVENHTGQFMPSCAEFARRARSILTPFLSELSSLRTEASKLFERAEEERRQHLIDLERQDPAVRARTAQLIADATKGAAKALPLRHAGLSDEVKAQLDAYRKPRPFVSKIEQTSMNPRTASE